MVFTLFHNVKLKIMYYTVKINIKFFEKYTQFRILVRLYIHCKHGCLKYAIELKGRIVQVKV